MSFGKNVKRSVTYQFQLTNSKLLAPVSRYKGYSKLYQLNLSKMLLKCPDSPFQKRDQYLANPEQLLVISTQKFHSHSNQKNNNGNISTTKCQSDLCKNKAETIKKSIRENLIYENKTYSSAKDETKNQKEDNARTTASPNNPNIIDFPLGQESQSTRSSFKFIKNDFFRVARKKNYDFTVINSKKSNEKQVLFEQHKHNDGKQMSQNKNTQKIDGNIQSSIVSQNRIETKRKISFNTNQQVIKRAKLSKKLILPQIKSAGEGPQSHTYNVSAKSNIPLLFRDPQQLKNIRAEAYGLIEYPSGNLILSNKGINQYEIASLTKIMTFFTTIKIVQKFSLSISRQNIRINDTAMDMSGTSAEILSGEVYTVQQLLYGLMLPSGNDAATALAQWGGKHLLKHHHPSHSHLHFLIDGHNNEMQSLQNSDSKSRIKAFINQMNFYAKQLGLSSTRYANPHGLPHSQARSTAIDVARLCFECLKEDLFRKVVSTHRFKCNPYQFHHPQIKRQVQWVNTNKLLRRQGFIGIKTGITVTAGPCLASAYKFRDKIYICVVLRATKVSRRFKETRKLLAWSLEKLYKQSLTNQQLKVISMLRKNRPELDSDYSEDEQQFNYEQMSKAEFKKRSNIINYQM